MGADPSEFGIEGLVLQNELSKAFTKVPPAGAPDLCSTTAPGFQERSKYSYTRHYREATAPEDRFRCIFFRENATAADAAAHVRAGFALSDLYCDTFFRRIAQNLSQRQFARGTTNDVGAAISAVLGLASAGSAVTGGIGAGFGLLDGGFRNYNENFLVTPDLPGVQKLVRTNQAKLREDTLAKMPTNYPDATMRIMEYANLCSYVGMKGLLNESVQDAADRGAGSGAVDEARLRFLTAEEDLAKQVAERKLKLAQDKAAAEKQLAELASQPTTDATQPAPQPQPEDPADAVGAGDAGGGEPPR